MRVSRQYPNIQPTETGERNFNQVQAAWASPKLCLQTSNSVTELPIYYVSSSGGRMSTLTETRNMIPKGRSIAGLGNQLIAIRLRLVLALLGLLRLRVWCPVQLPPLNAAAAFPLSTLLQKYLLYQKEDMLGPQSQRRVSPRSVRKMGTKSFHQHDLCAIKKGLSIRVLRRHLLSGTSGQR